MRFIVALTILSLSDAAMAQQQPSRRWKVLECLAIRREDKPRFGGDGLRAQPERNEDRRRRANRPAGQATALTFPAGSAALVRRAAPEGWS